MFDRFIRLAQAQKALREQRFEDAVRLADDPLIRGERRAADVRQGALAGLLGRARRHLQQGDLAAARALLAPLRLADAAAAAAFAAELAPAEAAAAAGVDLARKTLAEARRCLDRGETAAAAALLGTVPGELLLLDRQQLAHLLAERQRQAAAERQRAAAEARAGALAAAREAVRRAEALDRDGALAEPHWAGLRGDLAAAAAAELRAALQAPLASGDLAAAAQQWWAARAAWLDLAAGPAFAAVGEQLAAAVQARLGAATDAGAAAELCRQVRAAELPLPPAWRELAEALQQFAALPPGGDEAAPAQRLAAAAAAAGAAGLGAAAAAAAAAGAAQAERLAGARAQLAAGDLDGARAGLAALLADRPLHEAARRELELVDKSLAEWDQRLEQARTAAREGRLQAAAALALGLAASPRLGAAAQQVLAEARARSALVDRGLDEVRVALHGRGAATAEGVRHCLRRLEELAKVQVDHPELPKVAAAVGAEVAVLEALEALRAELGAANVLPQLPAAAAVLARRAELLAPDRLDARFADLGDALAAAAAKALAAGRLGEAEAVAAALPAFAVVQPEFAARARQLADAAAARREAAAALVAAAEAQLAGRDLAEAERLAEQAQVQWSDGAPVRALLERLRQLRGQADALARAEALAGQRDFRGAERKLAELAGSPALLRTRIFDMKQNLARAQGLEGTFLLRVDEGGEFLVARGESVAFGNVRHARAELPVLANLAGRHASIRRSMSFHGGMQDTVVAEEGEVRVGGAAVAERALQAGDRVQLGPSFAFVYQQPSPRSLSAALHLQGGFQVAGTDRVLLMKDRGRDGRLLLGAGRDAHVRVARATAEVEIFASNQGQMRVACAAGGRIDGVAFRGEHPVAAGQLVEAGGITFVMLPWRPAA